MTGTCEYCGQTHIISEEEYKDRFEIAGPLGDEEMILNALATHKCKCAEASIQRRREEKIKAAGDWIDNYFEDCPAAANAMNEVVNMVIKGVFPKVTIKSGKKTFTVDLDKDDCLRIRTKYVDTNEETF